MEGEDGFRGATVKRRLEIAAPFRGQLMSDGHGTRCVSRLMTRNQARVQKQKEEQKKKESPNLHLRTAGKAIKSNST